MNERIKQLAEQAGIQFPNNLVEGVNGPGVVSPKDKLAKFAELIIAECTGVLFDESEKLSALYSDEDNWQSAEEYEIRSDQCVDNIALIEEHFGVE